MKQNMGTTDRIFRISVAVIIAALYFTHVLSGLTATILLAVAVIFILTGFISMCPLYLPFGISTKAKRK